MLTIVIGTEPRQLVAQRVLEHSIRKHASKPVAIRGASQTQRRMGGTKFGFVRFLVPSLCGYEGRAIYMDADQLVLGDVCELAAQLEEPHAVGLVHDIVGSFGGKPVEPRNETSVMVLDCAKLRDWDPDTLFDRVVANDAAPGPGQIRYKDFMRLAWMDPARIQYVDPCWNHYNVVRDDTRLVHFSHVREQPWKRPAHPLTGFWSKWLRDALAGGALSRWELARDVALLRIHPHFLRCAF